MPMPSFCERIQAVLIGKPPASQAATFEQALASALSAPADDEPARTDAMRRLALVIGDGVPCGTLSSETHRLGTVLNLYLYERDPAWRFGTHRSRRKLIEEFWTRADSAPDRESAASLARAAVLLAAEERPPFGLATVRWLANRPSFKDLTGLADANVTAIVSELDREDLTTRSFVASLNRAKDAMDALLADHSGVDDAIANRLIAEFESIAALATSRPDIQWRLANMVWRLANTARARGRNDLVDSLRTSVSRWKATLAEASATRWLDEAMTAPAPPLRTSGFRRVMSSEHLRVIRG
jgi:hypothetical protein